MNDGPLVLGIETSCDETGVGIVRGHTLLADAIASSARHGSGSSPCSSWSTATWAARWLTPYNGLPRPRARAFAAATPTSRAPARPGPLVTALASTSESRMPAVSQARSMVGTIASRCAREATSGTTPPNRACSSTLEATASASRVCPRTMPTPVSSQEVSMPSTRGWSVMRVIVSRAPSRPRPPRRGSSAGACRSR